MPEPDTAAGKVADPVHLALGLAGIRAVVGAGLLLAPGLAARLLVGADASRSSVRLLARAAGIRDLALALDLVWALDRPADLPRVHRLHAVVDGCDAVAGLLAGSGVPARGRLLATVGGTVAAASGSMLARRWARDPQVTAASR